MLAGAPRPDFIFQFLLFLVRTCSQCSCQASTNGMELLSMRTGLEAGESRQDTYISMQAVVHRDALAEGQGVLANHGLSIGKLPLNAHHGLERYAPVPKPCTR